jgi:hypothetical protein
MTLDIVLENVNYRVNKDNSGNALSPDEFNAILELVNIEYFKWNFGLPEQYKPNMTFAAREWEVNQKITDDMNPFLVTLDGAVKPFLQVSNKGLAILPEDYFHVSSIGYDLMEGDSTKRYIVEIMTNAQWNSRLGSHILKPALDCPIARFISGQLEFAPKNIGQVDFSYLRKPTIPFYATTEDPITEDMVYDPANSVQLEWPPDCITDITNMLVSYASDNLGMMEIKQSAETRKAQGV